ncbi:MAG: hypothetical protein HYV95_06570 [Opitutae bacterium]|nr:hypothetical protein [Opitutae bacterium]
MPHHPPTASLPENTGLAFRGEAAWAPAALTGREAAALRRARNPTGRPNDDVLRRHVGVSAGREVHRWQIDFPAHFTAQEAALYEKPFARLTARAGDGWRNPHANAALRAAVARLERYLATPADAEEPAFVWLDVADLPDDSLLIVARDDDFTQGVLDSRAFAVWWRECPAARTPTRFVETFPFPWPPHTPLGSLTRAQEEHRHAVARAARNGDAEALDAAVAVAYGWPADLGDGELLARLRELHTQRAGG